MAQWLRETDILPEDPSNNPQNHMVDNNKIYNK